MKDADYFFDIVFESEHALQFEPNPQGKLINYILSEVEEKILRESEDMNLSELLELAVCYLSEDYRYIYDGGAV
tara:strand:- start:196 stop:417 length:222 start_codon:yes stop_codon:yes gene_type:complete